ncbi:MAG: hypothetical protein J6J36_08605 [Clostridia bacterium]|nr:hypothetical protein [Clostridia bacterium]
MKFESINNFEVGINNSKVSMNEESKAIIAKKDIEDIISNVNTSDEYDMDYKTYDEDYTLVNWMWGGTIILAFVVWIVCLISLIMNIVKKNVGKAIFSGIGLIVPIISIFVSTMGRTMFQLEENGISLAIVIFALLLELVFTILSFVFCFSKDKNK